MAPTIKSATEKSVIEKPADDKITDLYLLIIIIKLAFLCVLKFIKSIYSMHASYKKSLKKKYTATNIEARRPNSVNTENAK